MWKVLTLASLTFRFERGSFGKELAVVYMMCLVFMQVQAVLVTLQPLMP